MRKLYSFTLDKETSVDEIQVSKDAEGKEIKQVVKVSKKDPLKFFVAKPGRQLTEDSEMYFQEIFWKCQKRGILPASLMQKRFLEDGGVLSSDQKKEYNDLYDKLFQKQAAHRALGSKSEKTEEETQESKKIMDEIIEIMSTLQSFESKTSNDLYQNTAENLSRNRTALWFTLMLSYQEKDGKDIPFFGAGTFEQRLAKYDEMENREDAFEYQLIQKFLLICSLFYFGKAETQEDFDLLLKVSENSNLIEAAQTLGIKEEAKEKGPEIAPELEEVKV